MQWAFNVWYLKKPPLTIQRFSTGEGVVKLESIDFNRSRCHWIPAFAGMTTYLGLRQRSRRGQGMTKVLLSRAASGSACAGSMVTVFTRCVPST